MRWLALFCLFFSFHVFAFYPATATFSGLSVQNVPGIGSTTVASGAAANDALWVRGAAGRLTAGFSGTARIAAANDALYNVALKSTATLSKRAGSVALGALRLTPAYRTAAALAFVASLGLEFCDDFLDYCKKVDSSSLSFIYSPWFESRSCSPCLTGTPTSIANSRVSEMFAYAKSTGSDYIYSVSDIQTIEYSDVLVDVKVTYKYQSPTNELAYGYSVVGFSSSRVKCLSGTIPAQYSNGQYFCKASAPVQVSVPLSEPEFSAALASADDAQFPIPLVHDLLAKGMALPVDQPVIAPVVDQAVGTAYVDPVTGDVSVPVANVQSVATAAQPFSVNGAVTTAKADAVGNPIPGTSTNQNPVPNPNSDPTPTPTGPCDPTQKNYLTCLDSPSKPMPEHTTSTAQTFDDVFKTFKSRLDAAPVVSALSGFSQSVDISGAQCPAFSIDLSGTIIRSVVSTTLHCDLWSNPLIRQILSAVSLVCWSFLAFRIFASA